MYRALLTTEEVKKFCADFYELESARMTKVEITPIEHKVFQIDLVPEAVGVNLLQASFKDGLLNNDGWHKKFEKM